MDDAAIRGEGRYRFKKRELTKKGGRIYYLKLAAMSSAARSSYSIGCLRLLDLIALLILSYGWCWGVILVGRAGAAMPGGSPGGQGLARSATAQRLGPCGAGGSLASLVVTGGRG